MINPQHNDLPASKDPQSKDSEQTTKVDNLDNFESYYEYETGNSDINVKNRLKNSFEFWKNIGACNYVLDVINSGYKIPFVKEPESVFLKNNRSALEHSDFVEKAISDLVNANLVREVTEIPHCINPLTVSVNSTGKHRLILDLRHVNKQVLYSKFKFEDWKVASQFLTANSYGFVYDLKSGYHHLDIFENHQKYLGFSWKFGKVVKYYLFCVLPFGLCSAGYVFSKVLRPLVAHWRKNGIKVTLFLDDGLGLAETESLCRQQAMQVKEDIIKSGFVPNREKSIWEPSQVLTWLGFTWDLKRCLLLLPMNKIDDLLQLISVMLANITKTKIRLLAKFCGKIISFTPAIGNVTQIMTRCCFSVINIKDDWDQVVNLNFYPGCIDEFLFWKQNVKFIKPVPILYERAELNVFSDASDIGAAGILKEANVVMHKHWLQNEVGKSSTWRELKAIELCITSFTKLLQNNSVSFYSDNQSAVSIVKKGSKKSELQVMALSIFNTCVSNNISLFCHWIPRGENEQADALSRIIDIDDWGVSLEFFQFMNSMWGPYSVDRFANMNNAKLRKFNSLYWNPDTSAINAFSCNWKNENNWLVPPVSLASKCINHLISCSAQGTLIVPKWYSAPFWPLLFAKDMQYNPWVKDVLEFTEPDRILVAGQNKNSMFANGKFKGTLLAVRLDADTY